MVCTTTILRNFGKFMGFRWHDRCFGIRFMKPSPTTLLVLSLSIPTASVGCAGGSPEQSVDEGALVTDDDGSPKAAEGATFIINSAAKTFTVVAPNEEGIEQPVFVSVHIDGNLIEAIRKVREEAPAGLAEFEPGRRCRSTGGELVGGFSIAQAPNDSSRGFRYRLVRADARQNLELGPDAPLFWGQSAGTYRTCDEALEGARSFAEMIAAMSR